MKKIFFYALCLQLITAVGCNNNNKDKEPAADSTKVAVTQDMTIEQMRSFFATPPPSFKPGATRSNLSKYPDLDDKTKYVKFDYAILKSFIDSLDNVFGSKAREIHFVYGAYTKNDVERYLYTHVTEPPISPDEILDMPCLLVAYKDPKTNDFIYKDFGTLCPPPNSCESFFVIPVKKKNSTKDIPVFDPTATIDNYRKLYQTDQHPIYPLTETVKFDIAGIKYLVDSLDKEKGATTTQIYFAMGAYTNGDAQRYLVTHPGHNITIGEIQDRTCLLYAYKDPKVEGFIYADFGTLCPPPNSCDVFFYYGK